MKPYYEDDQVKLYHGDCLHVLAELPEASVDAVVADPPYGLEFMGKDWDRPWAVTPTARVGFAGREGNLTLPTHRDSRNANCRACGGRQRGAKRCSCSQPDWDRAPSMDMREFQQWCTAWASECLRVLKPGGHLLAFGGSRTWHRMACAIEDAGFELRDSIAWLYGSGFPKSLDVSKAIDKAAGAERTEGAREWSGGQRRAGVMGENLGTQTLTKFDTPATDAAKRWEGWGTALKPSHEPVVVARKPLSGTVAANVLEHGTGALNIDGCRVAHNEPIREMKPQANYGKFYGQGGRHETTTELKESGRWPTNVVLDGDMADALDEQSGTLKSGANPTRRGSDKFRNTYGDFAGQTECVAHRGDDEGGASRFFPVFRYEAKAPTAERPTYQPTRLRLRSDLTPEQVDRVTTRLREAGVDVA